jgi:molybdate transport system substrate-binding protein
MLKMAVVAVLVAAAGAGQAGPRARPAPATVRVAAAADLKPVLDEAARRLAARQPAIRIEPTYGSSGSMHAQILQHAPYDLFLSADVDYPRDLVAHGVGATGDLFTYATGRIVIWVPTTSKLAIERDGVRALEGASRIALANPLHAPYGKAAEDALRQAGLWDRMKGRLVLGENVAQAAQFVQSGAADAGIIARSLALTAPMRAAGRSWEIPEGAHAPLVQGGLILPWATSRAAAFRLRDFLLGDEGRQLLNVSGFGAPPR